MRPLTKIFIGAGIGFASGAVTGSLAVWFFMRKKYKELESLYNVVEDQYLKQFRKQCQEAVDEALEDLDNNNNPPKPEWKIDIHEDADELPDFDNTRQNLMPHVLEDIMEYGEHLDYDDVYLTYYSDGYLVNDNDDQPVNVATTIGFEALDKFGIYPDEPDHICVVNDVLKVYYDVYKVKERYGEDTFNHIDDTEEDEDDLGEE